MEGTVPKLKIQDVPKEILDKITSIHKAPGVPPGNVYLVKRLEHYTCYVNPVDHKEVLDYWIKTLKDSLPKEIEPE